MVYLGSYSNVLSQPTCVSFGAKEMWYKCWNHSMSGVIQVVPQSIKAPSVCSHLMVADGEIPSPPLLVCIVHTWFECIVLQSSQNLEWSPQSSMYISIARCRIILGSRIPWSQVSGSSRMPCIFETRDIHLHHRPHSRWIDDPARKERLLHVEAWYGCAKLTLAWYSSPTTNSTLQEVLLLPWL